MLLRFKMCRCYQLWQYRTVVDRTGRRRFGLQLGYNRAKIYRGLRIAARDGEHEFEDGKRDRADRLLELVRPEGDRLSDPSAGRDVRVYAGFGVLVVLGMVGLIGMIRTPQVQAQASNPAPGRGLARVGGRFVVVVDAAHGGDDAGGSLSGPMNGGEGSAGAGRVAEKAVSLEMSVRLRSLLAARGVSVVTTREGNASLDGDARAQIANRAVAGSAGSACLSLHASEAGAGVHIFVSSLAASPDAQARFLAWKTAQSAYVSRSLRLASAINSALEHSALAPSSGEGNLEGLRIPVTLARTGLPGVDSMACPAVAIEVAPLRGTDGAVVNEAGSQRYMLQVVQAVVAAVLEWKAEAAGGPLSPLDVPTGGKQP